MIPLKEMKSRISNKYTVLPLLYNYSYSNTYLSNCMFYEIGEDDEENDANAKQVENTLITIFGADDFKALNTISQFTKNNDELLKIHAAIVEKWRQKANDYICNYLQSEEYTKHGYFFMYVPNSL
jgi:hypothetical protein